MGKRMKVNGRFTLQSYSLHLPIVTTDSYENTSFHNIPSLSTGHYWSINPFHSMSRQLDIKELGTWKEDNDGERRGGLGQEEDEANRTQICM